MQKSGALFCFISVQSIGFFYSYDVLIIACPAHYTAVEDHSVAVVDLLVAVQIGGVGNDYLLFIAFPAGYIRVI